jgi:hypothetical protein
MNSPNPSRSTVALLLAGVALVTADLLTPPAHAQDKPDFARWEKAIAAFEQQDKDKPPPKNAILFVGSSTSGCGTWRSRFQVWT